MATELEIGRSPASGVGPAPSGLSQSSLSQAEPLVPNAEERGPERDKIDAMVALLNPTDFAPFVRGVTDDIYERLLTTLETYLRDNAEWNLRSDIDSARASARYLEKQMAEISDALGVSQYSQEARLGRIETLKARLEQALAQ